jgi:hypothetical protein
MKEETKIALKLMGIDPDCAHCTHYRPYSKRRTLGVCTKDKAVREGFKRCQRFEYVQGDSPKESIF